MGLSDWIFGSRAVRLAKVVLHGKYDESQAALEKLKDLEDRNRAIPLLLKHFRNTGDPYNHRKVARVLGAIGTEEVVEPLLEVFRQAKPSVIQNDGYYAEGDHEDGEPSAELVRVAGGIEKLKLICSSAEFQRIVVIAHNYGESSNPAVNRALGEIASPMAIERLMMVMRQRGWGAEVREPAREALIRAGKQAHPRILRELDVQLPLRWQVHCRREALRMLKESGDEDCVQAIKAVLQSDPTVAEDARAAIEAISERCEGIEVPPTTEDRPLPLKRVAETGDPYIDGCFQMEFDEFYDDRDWDEMAKHQAIVQTGVGLPDPGDRTIEEALRLASSFREECPDSDAPYRWLAIAYDSAGRTDDARGAVLDGLRLARSKHRLCDAMADIEWGARNLPEAVRWWMRAVVIQVATRNNENYCPFLELSYVPEALGMNDLSERLREYSDAIKSGKIRLSAEAAQVRRVEIRSQGSESMKRALELLHREYLL